MQGNEREQAKKQQQRLKLQLQLEKKPSFDSPHVQPRTYVRTWMMEAEEKEENNKYREEAEEEKSLSPTFCWKAAIHNTVDGYTRYTV